jgi:cytochrome c oxidase cbb3-type subunit 1
MPRLTGREWHSQGLIRAHYWLKFLGFTLMMTSLTTAGLVQAAGWALGYPVDQWGLALVPYWLLRAISGFMIVTGQCIFAYNTYKTLFTPRASADSTVKAREVKV